MSSCMPNDSLISLLAPRHGVTMYHLHFLLKFFRFRVQVLNLITTPLSCTSHDSSLKLAIGRRKLFNSSEIPRYTYDEMTITQYMVMFYMVMFWHQRRGISGHAVEIQVIKRRSNNSTVLMQRTKLWASSVDNNQPCGLFMEENSVNRQNQTLRRRSWQQQATFFVSHFVFAMIDCFSPWPT